MSALGDEFRAKAKEHSDASDELFKAADFDISPKKQAIAIIGKINSTVFSAAAKLADQAEYPASPAGNMAASVVNNMRRNDSVRKAVANGDWDQFNAIVSASGGGVSDGNGTGSGSDAGGTVAP